MKDNETRKEIEYEDAPSGSVTLYNYKEPFMPYKKGYGYEGVLLFDESSGKVQCHVCGEWLDYLPRHIRFEHNLNAQAYKDAVGLQKSTALISEKIRSNMIEAAKNNGSYEQVGKKPLWITRNKKRHAEALSIACKKRFSSREYQNKRGTCPYQLIDRLRKQADSLGRTPTKDEAIGLCTLRKVYGSYANALEIAGLSPVSKGRHVGDRPKVWRYDRKMLKRLLIDFRDRNGRMPSRSDIRRRLLPSIETFKKHFGSFKKAIESIK